MINNSPITKGTKSRKGSTSSSPSCGKDTVQSREMMSSSGKINDLTDSRFRKRFFIDEFVPENNLAVRSLRVSGKKQERGQSLLEQKEITDEYCTAERLTVEQTWEVAESASKHEMRKHFHKMIDFICASQNTSKPIKHAVFSHQSRSSRNKKSARELEKLVDLGITLHFARDRRKLDPNSDISEWMMWLLENLRNEAAAKEIQLNAMGGVIRTIERGVYPGSKLPYGYRSVGRKDRRRFELDGERAKYMATAFEIVDSPTYGSERLSDRSLKEKLDSMFPSIGRTPNKKRFCELLRNPFYTGEEFIYDKTVFKADPTIQTPLVSRERWLRVQEVLNGRKRTRRLSKKMPYIGMMICNGKILDAGGNATEEVCGCSITGERIRKKYTNGKVQFFDYYRCANQTRRCSQRDKIYMQKAGGRKVSYTDDEVEIIFRDIFKSFSFDEVTCRKMQQYLWDEHFDAKRSHSERRIQLERRMMELDSFIQRAYEDKLRGDLSEEKWRAMDYGWKAEHAKLMDEIGGLKDEKDEYMQRGVQLIELMQNAEIIFKNATPEKKRKMVELVSSNLMLKDGTLEYQWRKPFDMLAVKGDLVKWRSLGDSNPRYLREREMSWTGLDEGDT